MSKKRSLEAQEQVKPDLEKLVNQLYRDYVFEIEPNLWPWETERWHELAFCILITIGEPQVSAATIRHIVNILSELQLLHLDALAKLDVAEGTSDPLYITLTTLLQQVGYSPDKSKSAVITIAEAASIIHKKYGGKIQNCLRSYGNYMLDQIGKDFGFSQFCDSQRALAIWLQNILNIPIPAPNPIADQACASLSVTYDALIDAANQQDINIALLDDALRVYWEKMKVLVDIPTHQEEKLYDC